MTAWKISRSRTTAAAALVACVLFFTPFEVPADVPAEAASGALAGFVYGADGDTPVENAVVRLRNVEDGTDYESPPTDSAGVYAIAEVREGHYTLGVSTEDGDFNFEYMVLVKAGETGKLSLALRPGEPAPAAPAAEAGRKEIRETRIGRIVGFDFETGEAEVLIEKGVLRTGERVVIRGERTEFSQDVGMMFIRGESVDRAKEGQFMVFTVENPVEIGDIVYVVSDVVIVPFFRKPAGIAVLVAAGGVAIYGTYKLLQELGVISPKKK